MQDLDDNITLPQLILPNSDLKRTFDKFEIEALFKNAWLDLDVNEETLYNPLATIPEICQDRPELYIMWLMTKPEYFYLTCKVLLNVNLLPFQAVILEQMWNHKFPMLIGSRGMGKSFLMAIYIILRLMFIPNRKVIIAGAGFRQSKVVFQYIETIVNNSPILKDYLRANGGKDSFRKGTDEWRVDIGSSNAIAIPIGCMSPDTLVTTEDGIKQIIDLKENESTNMIWGNGKFRKQGFFFDSGICESFNVKTELGFEFTATPNHKMKINRNNEVVWCRTDELIVGDAILIDITDRWFDTNSDITSEQAYFIGLNNRKEIPKEILSTSKTRMKDYLKGVMFRTGINNINADYNPTIQIRDISKKLAKQIQYVLTHFSIISALVPSLKNKNNLTLIMDAYNAEQFENKVLDNNGYNSDDGYSCFYDKIVSIEKSIDQQMYDINIPEGNEYCANGFFSHNTGDKLRGKRSNDIFCDEFASMLIDIFETVIAGFGAVSSAPERNVKRVAAEKLARKMGLKVSDFEDLIETSLDVPNQIVISGTAYYDFNHFSKYHDKWRNIIRTRGDRRKLKDLMGGEELHESFKAEDYSIIRLPYELIPEGFMDATQVARSKATMHSGNYSMEYGSVFSRDSLGFFKRTLVESCVVKDGEDTLSINGKSYDAEDVFFEPMMYGDKKKTYVMGIDPAIAADNFAIVILEIDPPFRKIVYCWVTNKKDHTEKVKLGLTSEHNYYAYAARKVRELAKDFPCVRIAIDSEGGGRAILESLKDKDKLRPGEVPVYHIINPDKPNYEEDGETGLHIIDEISFSNGTWVSDANHGMKKDMEDGILLFPFVDSVSFAEADYEDEEAARHYDTSQQNIKDIEELKNELITIVVTESKTGREGFDTPEIKTGTGRKGRMKKDRYSALLMANMTGRQMMNATETDLTTYAGGFANFSTKKDNNQGKLFTGPSAIAEKLSNLYR